MVARRISPEEANRIPRITIKRFNEFYDGKVPVNQGLYYAIVASSPAVGVAYCNGPQPGFSRADRNYYIGFANGIDGTPVCFVDMDTLKR